MMSALIPNLAAFLIGQSKANVYYPNTIAHVYKLNWLFYE